MTVRRRKGRARPRQAGPPRYTATCVLGFEPLVAEEIAEFGGEKIRQGTGAVHWQGSLESAYRACLWSRVASRVFLELKRFPAPDPDAVQAGAESVDWLKHFGPEATFAVDCTLRGSSLTHSHYAALRVKDAVADSFRARLGKRPSVDIREADIRLNLHVDGEEAILSLDLSGGSLHRRGYRAESVRAPLKETLAAALLRLAGWDGSASHPVLLDPMCGSGTLLIEAAMIAGDTAPGLSRRRFGFTAWRRHDAALWDALVEEALAREERAMDRPWPRLLGWDCDPAAVRAARRNVRRAGFAGRIEIAEQPLARLTAPADHGLLLTNPPYGERLGEDAESRYLHRCLGRKMRERLPGWRAAVFTASQDLADQLGPGFRAGPALHNGPLRCRLHICDAVPPFEEETPEWTPREPEPGEGEDFANRLAKNLRHLGPWARNEGITCFRVYDRDLPDYNLAVDIYERRVVVQEFKAPASIPRERAEARRRLALRRIGEVLGVRRKRMVFKERRRGKGGQVYQAQGRGGKLLEVREGGLRFLVNFSDYLDTGLFLDHRQTRAMLAELAAGGRFLNLFGYTGAATVHAAAAGASTCTVDLSATYLERAAANLALNGLSGPAHHLVRAEAMAWLESEARGTFQCIFIDPPTFSNTAKKKQVFDVQQDHPRLLRLAARLLAPGGSLIFSTNFRGFRMDREVEAALGLEEITSRTVPRDFARRPPHRSWLLTAPGD